MFMHTEFLIHHTRIRTITRQMTNDIALIRSYLSTFTTGKLTPQKIDPAHLRQELLKINRQLPPKITLPEDPTINIWHYYRFLTVTPMIHGNKLLLMIKIPLLDSDSTMTLYKIHNLPIYNSDIGKSLSYQLEGSNLAITKDNSYVTILTEAEFIQCTLAQGHFCSLNTALYHIDYSKWCLSAMFLKHNDRINKYCPLSITNITGPQAIYLDQGSWAISIEKPTQMEIRCPQVTQVKSLKPLITFINLILLLIICGCLYWRCKNPQHSGARSPPHVTYTAPENQNMMHTTEDAIRSTRGSDLGLKTVRIQDPVGDMGKVVDVRVQHAFTEAVLD